MWWGTLSFVLWAHFKYTYAVRAWSIVQKQVTTAGPLGSNIIIMNWCNPLFGKYIPTQKEYAEESGQFKKGWLYNTTSAVFSTFHFFLLAPSSCDGDRGDEFFKSLEGKKWLQQMKNPNHMTVIRDTDFEADILKDVRKETSYIIPPKMVSDFSVKHIGKREAKFAENLTVVAKVKTTTETTAFWGNIEVFSKKTYLPDPVDELQEYIQDESEISNSSQLPVTMAIYAEGNELRMEKAINDRQIPVVLDTDWLPDEEKVPAKRKKKVKKKRSSKKKHAAAAETAEDAAAAETSEDAAAAETSKDAWDDQVSCGRSLLPRAERDVFLYSPNVKPMGDCRWVSFENVELDAPAAKQA